MSTHKIGKFKFNLSSRGFAYRMGDGEIHRIPFGRSKEEKYEEDYSAYDQDGAQYDDQYAEDNYAADRQYDEREYQDDRARSSRKNDYDDGYDDQSYDDRYDDRRGYEDEDYDDYEEASPFMRYVEENDWVTLVLLVLLPPLGIYLLWRRNAFESILRYALTALSAVWCLILLILIFSSIFGGRQDITNPVTNNILPSPAASAEATNAPKKTKKPSAAPTQTTLNIGDLTLSLTASPAPTPIGGGNTGANATPLAATPGTNAGTVYSPASGLYYHSNRECARIPAGVSISTVTVEIAESRRQHPCPTCYNLPTFWATSGGSRYHSDKNCDSMQNAVEYTQEAAEAENKVPCPKCLAGGAGTQPSTTAAAGVSSIIQSINSDKSGITVYMTKNGTNYHANANCRNMQGAEAVSLLTALKSGKPACTTCLPQASKKVYCTQNGTWYHSSNTCRGMKDARQIELAVALVMGKTACPDCMSTATSKPVNGKDPAKPTPTPRTSGGLEIENGVVYVYGTADGKYYHTYSVCGNMTNGTRVKLSYALAQKRPACPVCAQAANTTVYAMAGGTYYHANATCSDMPNASAGTLAAALASGYKRCPTCWEQQDKIDEASTTDKSNISVYVIPDGRYYHTKSNCNGMNGATKVKLAVALVQGKSACPDCASIGGRTVYAAEGETYYHYNKNHAAAGARSGSLALALTAGFKACPVCCVDNPVYTPAPTTPGASAPTSSGVYEEGRSGKKVYASLYGKYYHLNQSCADEDSDYITLEKALNYGKKPCPDCASYAAQTVYAKNGGLYYHYRRDCAGDGATSGQLDIALAYGFKACPVCVDGGETATPSPKPTSVPQDPTAKPVGTDTYREGTSGKKVYASAAGTYYHLNASCKTETGLDEVTLEKALNYGKKACPDCASYARKTVYAKQGGKYYHSDKSCETGLSGGQLGAALAYGFKECPYCIGGQSKDPGTDTPPASGKTIVYIDLDDLSYYHKNAKCPDVPMSASTDVTLQYALEWDYVPCPYCNPPKSIG